MDKKAVNQIRDDILSAALPAVPFDGWRWAVIEKAAEEAGHRPVVAKAVFPAKMADVFDGFADLADRQMLEALEDINPESLRIRDRVREALLARYRFLEPHKEAVRQSAKFFLNPARKPLGVRIIWRTADRIWDWAGDEATDYNRYTKRGLLSGIIVSTTLAWLEDASEDMDRTRAFLDRRIENVMQLNKALGKFKRAA